MTMDGLTALNVEPMIDSDLKDAARCGFLLLPCRRTEGVRVDPRSPRVLRYQESHSAEERAPLVREIAGGASGIS